MDEIFSADLRKKQFVANHSDQVSIFERDELSVAMNVKKVEGARIVWLNVALAKLDPVFSELEYDIAKYRTSIIEKCGYRISEQGHVVSETKAFVDRYGGRGIEGNGGAGRAAFLNGYYVKGVGRTSLLGDNDFGDHASGDAYLEESVREAIFGEIIAAEFPHSAVRILAIISINDTVWWESVDKRESLVLQVRPAFSRIGHFARALSYTSKREFNGILDHIRVKYAITQLFKQDGGIEATKNWILTMFTRMAEQLAYGFSQSLTQGSTTLSNWSADGRLLDYGASSALLPYTTAILSANGASLNLERNIETVLDEFSEVLELFYDVVPEFISVKNQIVAGKEKAKRLYFESLRNQFLRISGFVENDINSLSQTLQDSLTSAVKSMMKNGQRNNFDIVSNKLPMRAEIDFKIMLDEVVNKIKIFHPELEYEVDCFLKKSKTTKLLGYPRPELSRERAKIELYELVDPCYSCNESNYQPIINEDKISAVICEWVESNRRDTKVVNQDQCVGFAVSNENSFAIFSNEIGEFYALDENAKKPHGRKYLISDLLDRGKVGENFSINNFFRIPSCA